MDPVHGKLEVMGTVSQELRILLDGDAGDISVGGQGRGGDIVLKDDSGAVKVRLNAGGAEVEDPDPEDDIAEFQSETIILSGANGNLCLGGNGVDGDLLLMPSGAKGDITDVTKASIWLDGGNKTIRLRDSDGLDRIQLIANSGTIVVGGNGAHGDVRVFAKDVVGAKVNDGNYAAIWIRSDTGDIRLANGDCAEDFDVSESDDVEPGTVMVLDREGKLVQSTRAYDKKVAGVISGAGGHKPGIVLDSKGSQGRRLPVALAGKAYCKVDAQYGPIEAGDLLTTSPTPGHAMKANDSLAAFGAVIGKALRSLDAGSGLIPMLITLQ